MPISFQYAERYRLRRFYKYLTNVLAATRDLMVSIHTDHRLINRNFRVNAPTLMMRILRRSLPFLVSVVSRATVVNASTITPNNGLCTNVPFMRIFLYYNLARITYFLCPISRARFQANNRRLILRRGRLRRAINVLIGLLTKR